MSHSLSDESQRAINASMATIEEAKSPSVKIATRYWQSLRGQRRFPGRDDLTLRGMAAILPYSVIIGVIDDGADYEYRYVGDAQRQAYKTYFKGMRLSQIEIVVPELGDVLRGAYELLRSTGTPFLLRGKADYEVIDSRRRFHETALLPLGVSDAAVDHILVVGVQVPDPFWKLSEDRRKDLVLQLGAPAVLC